MTEPATDVIPIGTNHITAWQLHQKCYGDTIPYATAAVSDIAGLGLHICALCRADIPGLTSCNSPLFCDVFDDSLPAARKLHQGRNNAIDDCNWATSERHVDISLTGAFALSASNFYCVQGKIMLPITTMWWWKSVLPWQTYLRATNTSRVRRGMLAAMMYTVAPPDNPDNPTTLVVEIHSNSQTCDTSVGAREQRFHDWYRGRRIPRPIRIPSSTVSVLLPQQGFCQAFA